MKRALTGLRLVCPAADDNFEILSKYQVSHALSGRRPAADDDYEIVVSLYANLVHENQSKLFPGPSNVLLGETFSWRKNW